MDFILEGFVTAFRLLTHFDPETFSAVWATLAVSGLSMATTLVLGIPLGFVLGYFRFPGRRAARTLVETSLSMPTVVIGLIVYAFLSRRGPLGELGLLFTISGMAIGLTILGLPIVIAITAGAVEGLEERLRMTLLTLGANKRQVALASLWEARFAVLLGAITAFGRIVSEVGIAMMVGGNVKWHTRTITTAIALETNKGEFGSGIALGCVLMLIALAVNLAAGFFRRRARP